MAEQEQQRAQCLGLDGTGSHWEEAVTNAAAEEVAAGRALVRNLARKSSKLQEGAWPRPGKALPPVGTSQVPGVGARPTAG